MYCSLLKTKKIGKDRFILSQICIVLLRTVVEIPQVSHVYALGTFLLFLAISNALLTCLAMSGSKKPDPDVQEDAGDIGSLLSAFELI